MRRNLPLVIFDSSYCSQLNLPERICPVKVSKMDWQNASSWGYTLKMPLMKPEKCVANVVAKMDIFIKSLVEAETVCAEIRPITGQV